MEANGSLTPKQQTFVTAYLTPGLTIEAAAKVAGIGATTAYRFLKLPHVKTAIKQARADLYEQAMGGLVHLIEKSVKTLDRNMDGEEVPASVQVQAAKIVLDQATVIYKSEELDARITELEEMIQDGRP